MIEDDDNDDNNSFVSAVGSINVRIKPLESELH
jgi:hypothetical protein